MAEELPPPIALAMIICDAIWIDPSTGKPTLLGMFSSIAAKTFPATHPLLATHVCLTDGEGVIPIKIRLIDADEENDPLFELEAELEFPDRRAIIDMNAHMKDIAFPAPGEYRLQLFARNQFVIERRLVVKNIGGTP
jgi:hypothetical protein